jgi:hypothetical protein
MKKILLVSILSFLLLASVWSCKDVLSNAHVRFQNNSATLTVDAVWDGSVVATVAPGLLSGYSDQAPGTHSLQWKDHATGAALTEVSSPAVLGGQDYTFTYTD